MAQYIDKAAVVAEIGRLMCSLSPNFYEYDYDAAKVELLEKIEEFIDTLEVKEVDLELITGWFDHIAQIADDRMTLTNQRMTDAHALDEIKCLARNSSEFIKIHYKVQKGE